jgi:tetratricopeptide (TPR) repeat protein
MSIDVYQNCPVHNDKKIKFCCGKDVVAELDHIMELYRSKQSAAALDAIEKAENRIGQRDCLLNLKTRVLISQHETELAEQTNSLFLKANPGHMLGMQHQALILAQRHEIEGAVDALQKAADAVGDGQIPFSIINTFRVVGAALVAVGDPIAGRSHLNFFKRFKSEESREIDYLLFQSFGGPHVPLTLKAEQPLKPCDEKEPFYKHNQAILLLNERGRWARAISVARKAIEQFGKQPVLVRNLAILLSMIGKHVEASTNWNDFAEMANVRQWEAIEAKALSILLNRESASDRVEVVKLSWPLTDARRAVEQADDHCHFESNPISHDDQDGPPPKASYVIWSDEPKSAAMTQSVDDLPVDVGFCAIYGKQTDRDARLDMVARSGHELENARQLVEKTFGDNLVDSPTQETLGEQSQEAAISEWRVRFPDELEGQDRLHLQREMERKRIRDIWPNVSYGILEHKSLKEASAIPHLQLACRAVAWIMHLSILNNENVQTAIKQVCEDLQIGLPGDQDISEFENATVPISWMHKIDPAKCREHELSNIIHWAMVHQNMACLRRCLPVMLENGNLDKKSQVNLLWTYGRVALDNDEAIRSVQKARDLADDAGSSKALWLVRELEIRMERGMDEGVTDLFKEIGIRCTTDEQVAEEFTRLLMRFNMINEEGDLNPEFANQMQDEPETPANEGIWTPDNEPSKVGAESKLWIPGND